MSQRIEEGTTQSDALLRLEKLEETLRTLSVLSHKINNPLTALLGRAQILKSKVQGDPNLEKAAGVIEESASRIAQLARELSGVLKEARQDSGDQLITDDMLQR